MIKYISICIIVIIHVVLCGISVKTMIVRAVVPIISIRVVIIVKALIRPIL